MKARLVITGILLLALCLATPAKAEKLTVVADEWPPFSGADLPNKGLSLDVIQTVLERAGYEVEVAVIPWARIMDGARNGTYDIVGSLFHTADLEPHMRYSAPYYTTDVRFLRKVGTDHAYRSLDDLRSYSIAVGDGFLYSDEFDHADYLNKVVVTTTLQSVRMVAHGRADITLDSEEVVRHALEREDPGLLDMVEFLPIPLASRGIHMAVRKSLPNHERIVRDFDRTLLAMQQDGSYDALLAEHPFIGR